MRGRRIARWAVILAGAYLLVGFGAMIVWGVRVDYLEFGPQALAVGIGGWLTGWLFARRESTPSRE